MTDIPHFAFPFRFANGKAVEVEQDSIEDIASCVHAILVVERGEFVHMSEFGVLDQAFLRGGVDTGALIRSIENQEPRASASIEGGWDFDQFIQYLRMTIKGADVG